MLSALARPRRRGAVAPLTAVLLIPLLGMLAFTVDVGYIVVTQTELQNAADAAALAGVQKLHNPFAKWSLPNLTSGQKANLLSDAKANARQAAKTYSAYNKAGNVTILLQDADIVFGFTDTQGTFTTELSSSTFPNTVQVTARRDNTGGSQTNTALALFFGPLLGRASVNLTATARATAYTGTITGFDQNATVNGLLLPVAVPVSDWNDFFTNGTNSTTNNSPNGLPQMEIYPGGGGQPGNRGLLSLDGSAAPSQQNYSGSNGWIQGGPTTTDVRNLYTAGNLPLGSSASNWAAGPGLKSSLEPDFDAMVGVSKLLPLFDTAGANGSNAWYHVVAIVGVTITYADGSGSNMTINVQPSATIDPTQLISPSTIRPMGVAPPAGSAPTFTFLPPKLTY